MGLRLQLRLKKKKLYRRVIKVANYYSETKIPKFDFPKVKNPNVIFSNGIPQKILKIEQYPETKIVGFDFPEVKNPNVNFQNAISQKISKIKIH